MCVHTVQQANAQKELGYQHFRPSTQSLPLTRVVQARRKRASNHPPWNSPVAPAQWAGVL